MAEINGSGIEIASLVHFLVSMGKTGEMLVWRSHWVGLLSFERGRLSAAAAEGSHGMAALEFISGALQGGNFEFFEGPPSLSPNLGGGPDPLVELDRWQTSRVGCPIIDLPAPTAVPRLAPDGTVDDVPTHLTLEAIHVLLAVDGRRNVRDIAERYGVPRTLTSLGRLRELGLVEFEMPVEFHPHELELSPPAELQPSGPDTPRADTQIEAWRRRVAHRGLSVARSEIVQAVVATGLLILGVRSAIQNFRVDGVSMHPTFDGGQVLVVNRAAYFHVEKTPLERILQTNRQGSTRYLFGGPQRGDVAVFHAPPEPNVDYIKRVIGLPGDAVLIKNGQVFINDELMDEPYVRFPATYNFPPDGNPLVVPDRNYFVLGDNRPDSFDSHFGWLVPVDDLIGRAWIRYWPPDDLSVVAPGAAAVVQAAAPGG